MTHASKRSNAALDVSVLLPTFNREGFIRSALLSILEQSRPPREIIVIDDGSTDATESVCAEFGDALQYVKQPENKGKTAAINRGLQLASGEFIWVMDDDDIAPPHALAELHAPLQRRRDLGFSYGRLQKFTESADGRRVFEPAQDWPSDDPRSLFVRLMEDCFITGQPCVLVRKNCFDAIAPIDENVRVSVDYNILLQLARRFDGVDTGGVVLWQRQHAGMRGPAANRYTERQRVQRWADSDARLIKRLFSNLRLAELLGYRGVGTPLTPVELRRALFQKAVIAARKNLWDIAIPTLRTARLFAPDESLAPADSFILQNMLGSRYGIDALINDGARLDTLVRAAGPEALGEDIRATIAARLTYWIGQAIKDADTQRLARTTAALVQLAGKHSLPIGLRPFAKRIRLRYGALARKQQPAPAAAALGQGAGQGAGQKA